MNCEKRQEIEQKVVRHLVQTLKARGWEAAWVHDGEAKSCPKTEEDILETVFSVEEATIGFRKLLKDKKFGALTGVTHSVCLAMGNGHDVIADHTLSSGNLLDDDFEEAMNEVDQAIEIWQFKALRKQMAISKSEALQLLEQLEGDFEMLMNGRWVPDEDSAGASLDNVRAVKAFVEKLEDDSPDEPVFLPVFLPDECEDTLSPDERQEVERKIVRHLLQTMATNGWNVTWIVNDGGDVGKPTTEDEVMAAVFSVTSCSIGFKKEDIIRSVTVSIGDGYQVIADNSLSNGKIPYDDFEHVMAEVFSFAEKLDM